MIENTDQRSKDYSEIKDKFRPGHADFTYQQKYGIRDYKGSGRASARETAARVAAGAVARQVLQNVTIRGSLVQMGPHKINRDNFDWDQVGENPFFCADASAAADWEVYLDGIRKDGNSVGAVIEVVAEGVPPGWGAPIYGKLSADLASAMMSINAVKGVEIGDGFAAASLTGTENADEMRAGNAGPRFHVEPGRGHSGRHFQRRSGRRALRRQADLVDPHAARIRHHPQREHRGRHQGPPRSLRRHSRRTDRRSHDGPGPRRPLSSSPRSDRPRRWNRILMMRATGPFEVNLSPLAADEREAAAFLGRLAIDKTFHGDLEATSVGQMMAARGDQPASAGYVAIERVTGTLAGHTGSFILQHSGHSSPAGQSLSINVVADSGTDGLKGLSGTMKIIIAEGGAHSYEFDYELPA